MERMKKTLISLLAGLLVLPAYTQTVTPETKAFIVEQMKDFTSTLNHVITLFEEDAIDVKTMDRLFGGDYLTVNGTKYGKLSAWIDRYYRGQRQRNSDPAQQHLGTVPRRGQVPRDGRRR